MNKKIFIDFDDTICLHKGKIRTEKYIRMLPEEIVVQAYENSQLNTSLYKWLINLQQNRQWDVKIYLLTHSSSFMLEAKKLWLEDNCPDIEFTDYIAISYDISKIDVIQSYYEAYGNACKIIVVDDDPTYRNALEDANNQIVIYNPQFLSNRSKEKEQPQN